jgi:hypothetical protein
MHSSQDEGVKRIEDVARKAAERNVYSLSNPYTTRDEKLEIEVWYQLPLDLSGVACLVTGILWAYGNLVWWEAYLIAFGVGVVTAILLWFAYAPAVTIALSKILRFSHARLGCSHRLRCLACDQGLMDAGGFYHWEPGLV